MRKQRVLHLLSSNDFSGAENVVCTIIENDVNYDMYYGCVPGPIITILKDKKINYVPIKKLSPSLVKKACLDNEIDILHAHDYKASFCASLSGFKGKIISHIHCNPAFSHKWNPFTIGYRLFIKRFNKIIFVSKEAKEEAIYLKAGQSNAVVIENVVNKQTIINKSREFKADKYDVVYLGRLTDVKRPQMVIEIIKKLRENFPKIKACMIGDGNLRGEIEKMIKDYQLEKNVELLGFKSNPFPYVKNSKVALLTSEHEGLPMSVIECMALGVPVLNSGVGGLSTLFENNKNFICSSVDDYCDKVGKIINGDNSFKASCDKIISNRINVSQYVDKINNVYK